MNSSYTGRSGRNRRQASPAQNFFMFLLKCALPFLLINGLIFFVVTSKPKLITEIGSTDDYRSTQVTVLVKSFLPTKNLTASMDGQELVLETKKKGQYTASVEKNGVLEVYVENFNGMSATIFQPIDILDDNPPVISRHYIEEGILAFELEDSQSGIDFTSIRGIDSTGAEVAPLTIDKVKNLVTFTMDPDGLVIFIKDMSGHEIQATFTSHMEGGKEVSETTSAEITETETNAETQAQTETATQKETKSQ